MNTYSHNKNSNTIKSSSFIAVWNSYKVVLILRQWDHVGRVLWWYQMSLCNRVMIKVDLDTLKVLVEAHGSRVGFVRPDDGKIYSGPSQWYCIDTACKHVTRSHECLMTEQEKSACREHDQTRYGWYQMIAYRTSNISQDKRNWLHR
jgi:hypothetical protein